MFHRRSLWLTVVVVLVIAPACSSNSPAPQAAPPTATSGSQAAPPTNTLPPAAPTNVPVPDSAPTIEPPQPTEIPPATATATTTFTPMPKPRGTAATARPRGTAAPLNVTYEVIEVKRKSGEEATLVLKVIATGGSGGYRYYHDDIQQPSATFNIAGTCGKPFVHTIKVTSSDGQTIALPYHVNGVCPTPTP
jgi:hypothetical protein